MYWDSLPQSSDSGDSQHPADVLATWADIEKSKDKLGWKPTVSIEEGVQHTVDWYLKNREFLNRLKD